MSRTDEKFIPALKDKKIPILTLDNKWHQLFTQVKQTPEMVQLAESLNSLIKKQAKANEEIRKLKKIKKKLMQEILEQSSEASATENAEASKKSLDNSKLINECNQKIEEYEDELLDLPSQMDELNRQLMLLSMEQCYDILRNNEQEIDDIVKWIAEIRVELKKRIIRKQEKEAQTQELYSYMHDIFGAEVIELFDLKYNRE